MKFPENAVFSLASVMCGQNMSIPWSINVYNDEFVFFLKGRWRNDLVWNWGKKKKMISNLCFNVQFHWQRNSVQPTEGSGHECTFLVQDLAWERVQSEHHFFSSAIKICHQSPVLEMPQLEKQNLLTWKNWRHHQLSSWQHQDKDLENLAALADWLTHPLFQFLFPLGQVELENHRVLGDMMDLKPPLAQDKYLSLKGLKHGILLSWIFQTPLVVLKNSHFQIHIGHTPTFLLVFAPHEEHGISYGNLYHRHRKIA